tara:strand:+ start:61860 stop:62495 length:636 start_codon:yes stop_codon:yes gene_type:complete
LKAIILLTGLAFLQVSCSSTEQKSTAPKKNYAKQIKIMKRTLNKQASLVKQLKEENEKLQLQMMGKNSLMDTDETIETTKTSVEENRLFSSFLSAHNSRRFRESNRAFDMMEKSFPQSSLFVEAIYLKGKYSIQQKAYKTALTHMNRIINSYPKYQRAKSAMLAKAIIYRRLNLLSPSKSVLRDLIGKFPKSNEAKKAQSHLALLEKVGEQ